MWDASIPEEEILIPGSGWPRTPFPAAAQAFPPAATSAFSGASLGTTFYILYSCFKKRSTEPRGFLSKGQA